MNLRLQLTVLSAGSRCYNPVFDGELPVGIVPILHRKTDLASSLAHACCGIAEGKYCVAK